MQDWGFESSLNATINIPVSRNQKFIASINKSRMEQQADMLDLQALDRLVLNNSAEPKDEDLVEITEEPEGAKKQQRVIMSRQGKREK